MAAIHPLAAVRRRLIGQGRLKAACQKGLPVGFITASALVHQLLEARDEKRLLRLQKQLAKYALLMELSAESEL